MYYLLLWRLDWKEKIFRKLDKFKVPKVKQWASIRHSWTFAGLAFKRASSCLTQKGKQDLTAYHAPPSPHELHSELKCQGRVF